MTLTLETYPIWRRARRGGLISWETTRLLVSVQIFVTFGSAQISLAQPIIKLVTKQRVPPGWRGRTVDGACWCPGQGCRPRCDRTNTMKFYGLRVYVNLSTTDDAATK